MPRDEAPAARAGVGGRLWAAYGLLSLLTVGWFATGIFAVDSYNHITRLTISCAPATDPLRAMWQVEYGLIPNLAIDLLYRPLCGVIAPEPFLVALTSLTVAAILALAIPLQRRLAGANSVTLLLAVPMMFNIITFMGYTNYLIGLAVLMGFAIWLFDRPLDERRTAWLLAGANLGGTLLLFSHVFAAMVGGVLYGARLLRRVDWRDRAALLRAALLAAGGYIVPVALVLIAEKSGANDVAWWPLSKVRGLFGTFLYASVPVAGLCITLTSVLVYGLLREKMMTVSRENRRILLLFVAFALILPTQIGDAIDIDSRTMVFFTLFALLTLAPLAGVSRRAAMLTFATAAVGVAAQMASALPARRALERDVAEVRAAARVLPPHATVISAFRGGERRAQTLLLTHMASLATLEAKAFNPLEFSGHGMQPLDATPGFACINTPVGAPFDRKTLTKLTPKVYARQKKAIQRGLRYAADWRRTFSHVLYYRQPGQLGLAHLGLVPLVEGSAFILYANPRVAAPGPQGPCAAFAAAGLGVKK